MKHRGLYGQNEGNETNSTATLEHWADNIVVESEEVAAIRDFLRRGNLFEASMYMSDMRERGFSEIRIQAIYGQASCGVKF